MNSSGVKECSRRVSNNYYIYKKPFNNLDDFEKGEYTWTARMPALERTRQEMKSEGQALPYKGRGQAGENME